jgi:hypothetical protein
VFVQTVEDNVAASSIKIALVIAVKYKLVMRGGDLVGAYLVTQANPDFPVNIRLLPKKLIHHFDTYWIPVCPKFRSSSKTRNDQVKISILQFILACRNKSFYRDFRSIVPTFGSVSSFGTHWDPDLNLQFPPVPAPTVHLSQLLT